MVIRDNRSNQTNHSRIQMGTKTMTKHYRRALLSVIATAALSAVMLAWPAASRAAPVQYVKICSLYGSGYFYIPGTDICQDANQIAANQRALSDFSSTAFQGVAISTSMVTPFMPSMANFAVSAHWATFSGKNALGLGGLMRVSNSNLFLSGAIGGSFEGGPMAGRAGFEFAW